MAIDTPARLAIVGAGPIGLEAALYARFLGYDVVIYERGEVAESVRQRESSQMNTPFRENRTTLGMAAIQAQDENYRPPGDEAVLTWREWIDTYLWPLSQSDLIADHLRPHTTVVKVEQVETESDEWEDEVEGGGTPHFRVVARESAGAMQAELFHGVLDCTSGDEIDALSSQSLPEYHVLREGGYDQIRKVFCLIGDRESLDLYASAARLVR